MASTLHVDSCVGFVQIRFHGWLHYYPYSIAILVHRDCFPILNTITLAKQLLQHIH